MGKMNSKQKFMFKHIREITNFYRYEALCLGYKGDQEIGDYIKKTLHACTFVGTRRELKKEFRTKKDYVLICRGLFLFAVETFNGKIYNILN